MRQYQGHGTIPRVLGSWLKVRKGPACLSPWTCEFEIQLLSLGPLRFISSLSKCPASTPFPAPSRSLSLPPTPQASTYRVWPGRDGWSPARNTRSPIVLDSASCPPVPVREEHMAALPQGEGMVFGLRAPWRLSLSTALGLTQPVWHGGLVLLLLHPDIGLLSPMLAPTGLLGFRRGSWIATTGEKHELHYQVHLSSSSSAYIDCVILGQSPNFSEPSCAHP